jgi:hypothetical protein
MTLRNVVKEMLPKFLASVCSFVSGEFSRNRVNRRDSANPYSDIYFQGDSIFLHIFIKGKVVPVLNAYFNSLDVVSSVYVLTENSFLFHILVKEYCVAKSEMALLYPYEI